jgi:hypothetical protein
MYEMEVAWSLYSEPAPPQGHNIVTRLLQKGEIAPTKQLIRLVTREGHMVTLVRNTNSSFFPKFANFSFLGTRQNPDNGQAPPFPAAFDKTKKQD